LLDALGFDVDVCIDPEKALKRIKPNLYDIIITDLHMPQMSGIKFVREIRKKDENVKIILCSGNPGDVSPEELHTLGLDSIMQKPLEYGELAQKIKKAMSQ